MKTFLAVLCIPLSTVAAGGTLPLAEFTVTSELLAPKPISPRLYGNFIELGYGFQVEPMMAQMFFNRSFEPFPPYKPISIEWFDLWRDPRNPALGYKTDWSGEDWYHSGYEHNPWFPAPGKGGKLPIDDKATFLIPRAPSSEVVLEAQTGGSGHGVQHLRVRNRSAWAWAGLAQEGKWLRKGMTYRFQGMFRAANASVQTELRLYPEGDWSRPLAVAKLDAIGDRWCKRAASLVNRDFQGRATFALWLPPAADLSVDDFSLLPEDHFHGWRSDILGPLREVRPGVLRVPGGCFASFHDWRDGIGPLPQRKPLPSHFWGGQNSNDVGVAELAMLGRAIGAELMWCVNVHHPLKRDYEWWFGDDGPPPGRHGHDFSGFADIGAGARAAADLVAYCNLPADRHPMARLRAKHGFPEPFGIRFWELDNEVHRWFEPEEYARATLAYAQAMKQVDPSIKIGMVSYGERLGKDGKPRVTFHERIPTMLEIAGGSIDFLADRGPSEAGYLEQVIGWIRDFNTRHGTSIVYCETEKLFYEQFPDVENRVRPDGGYNKSFMFSKWFYALKAIMDYMAYQRAGGDIDFVIFNNLANTHSQCVIDTPKEGVFLTAAGVAMRQLARSTAAWPLRFDGYQARFDDNFQVAAAWDQSRRKLVIHVLNRTAVERDVSFRLERVGRRFRQSRGESLWAPDAFAMNTLAHPDAVRLERAEPQVLDSPAECRLRVKPWSFTETVLE